MPVAHFEPDRSRFAVRGIDVSHHQGTIDWDAVAGDDVSFVYLKASEGGDHRDRAFGRNLAEAGRVGLPAGAYHFFSFRRPGADQARNFTSAVPPGAVQLPPAIDLEFLGNSDHRPASAELRRELDDFFGPVEDHFGRQLVVYASDDFLAAYGAVLPRRRFWRRSIGCKPEAADWAIWQYDAAGRIAGIDGDVDLNVLSTTVEALKSAA